jgi:hypothetical protein
MRRGYRSAAKPSEVAVAAVYVHHQRALCRRKHDARGTEALEIVVAVQIFGLTG